MKPEKIKRKNEKWLKRRGFLVNPNLPLIEDPSELVLRSPQEISKRAWILNFIIGLGYKQDPEKMIKLIKSNGLESSLSSEEKSLLEKGSLTDDELWEATELCHSSHALTWILGYRDFDPVGDCPDDVADLFFTEGHDVESLGNKSNPKSFDEAYVMADLLYRLHWSIRHPTLQGEKPNIQEWTVRNRRRAIDWALTVQDDWDDVTTDT